LHILQELQNVQNYVICICMTHDSPATDVTLRERNRLATRRAIADAALHLAMHDGLAAVRNEDIARAAGVSLRTFSNYFANKYEALSVRHVERMQFAAAALRDRPAAEPLWTAISAAVLAPWLDVIEVSDPLSSATLGELRLLFGSRPVQAEVMTAAIDPENDFARAVADRLGMDVVQNIYPRLVAAAATAVTQVALDIFLRSDPPADPLPLISDALAQLARGLPEPERQDDLNDDNDLNDLDLQVKQDEK
jgi:AcrR family transcriptional regulator